MFLKQVRIKLEFEWVAIHNSPFEYKYVCMPILMVWYQFLFVDYM